MIIDNVISILRKLSHTCTCTTLKHYCSRSMIQPFPQLLFSELQYNYPYFLCTVKLNYISYYNIIKGQLHFKHFTAKRVAVK